jgi:hypothetical protein
LIRRTVLLVALALIATACQIRFDTSVVVNEDGSGSFTIEIGLDEEFRQLSESSDDTSDPTEGFDEIPDGWTSEPFTDGKFEGVRVSTDFNSLEDLNTRLAQLNELSTEEEGSPTDLFQDMSIEESGGTFTFRAGAEGLAESVLSDDEGGFEGLDPSALFGELFLIRLLVTLPGEPGEHNADELVENTFIWNIGLDDEGSEFIATSSTGGGLNALVIVLLIVAVAAVAMYLLAKRNDTSDDDEQPAPETSVDTGETSDPFEA